MSRVLKMSWLSWRKFRVYFLQQKTVCQWARENSCVRVPYLINLFVLFNLFWTTNGDNSKLLTRVSMHVFHIFPPYFWSKYFPNFLGHLSCELKRSSVTQWLTCLNELDLLMRERRNRSKWWIPDVNKVHGCTHCVYLLWLPSSHIR